MKIRNAFKATGLALALLVSVAPGPAGAAPAPATTQAALPADSVYLLATPLTDQGGRKFVLGEQRGKPMIVSMFYTSCQFVCPMLVDGIRATQAKLSDAERGRMNVLMVTFDPQKDTVEVLKKTAQERELDSSSWTLARTDANNVRRLAAVLGIQYKAIGNGDYNHSTALILLDGDGHIVGRTSQLGDADPAFVKLVKKTLAATR